MLKFSAEKMWKTTHIFSAKNIRILYILSAKTVNEMTLNELVKLTTLWTNGPRSRKSPLNLETVFPNMTEIFLLGHIIWIHLSVYAGLGGSAGCGSDWWSGGYGFDPAGVATFFRGDWSWNSFYGHSLPSADSRRAFVSFWWKNLHNTG